MTVEVLIHGRDFNVSPRLKEYVEKKLSKLDRYLPIITDARVDLSELKNARAAADRHVAQVTIQSRGMVLRAEERKDDIYAAVDAVLDKIHRQIERYKGKHWKGAGNRAGADSLAAEQAPVELPEIETDGSVVRRKRFSLTPMSESEALDQMRLVSHENFFVFYNAETNRVNVLYHRQDGDFGLIDPEIG